MLKRAGERLSGLVDGYLLTILSVIIAAGVIGYLFYNRASLLKKFNEQATSSVENGSVYKETTEDEDLYEITSADAFPELTFPHSDVYDEDGRISVDVTCDDSGNIVSALYYTYGENGETLCVSEYSADGGLVKKTIYPTADDEDYSDFAAVVQTVEYDNSNRFNGYNAVCLDGDGVAEKTVYFSSAGIIEKYIFYEYDEAGKILKETSYSSHDVISSYTDYEYDEVGNLTVKTQSDETGDEILRDVFYYDEENRLIRDESYLNSVCITFSEYEYDEYGNRTRYVSTLTDSDEQIYDRKQVSE